MKKIKIKNNRYNSIFESRPSYLFEDDDEENVSNPAFDDDEDTNTGGGEESSSQPTDEVDHKVKDGKDESADDAGKQNTDNIDLEDKGTGAEVTDILTDAAVQYNGDKRDVIATFINGSELAKKFLQCKFFNIKLTQDPLLDMVFPRAGTQLKSLMTPTSMPKKFKNIYASYDNKPLLTIEKAEDKAEKYFSIFKKNAVDESLNYLGKPLYEDGVMGAAVSAAGSGLAVSKGIASGALIFSGFFAGLIPGCAAISSLGGMSAMMQGEYITNDKELHKQYSEEVEKKKSLQNNAYAAIDNYVNSIMIVMEQSVRHITSDNGSREFTKLYQYVTNMLSAGTANEVANIVKNNNEELKHLRKEQLDKIKNERDNLKAFYKNITGHILGKNGPRNVDDIISYISTSHKHFKNSQKYSHTSLLDDSIHYTNMYILNEDEEPANSSPIEVDADELYNNTKATIRSSMKKILESKPEDWELVKIARKQMEALKKNADDEIKNSIQQVCRTANSGQMNLGGKLMAFVAKHPMRANKLNNLWARHMVDLDSRIEQRIKQISELDGKGPLAMAKEFYLETFPSLIAAMVLYKTIIRMLNDKRLFDPEMVLMGANKESFNVDDYITAFADAVAKTFAVGSVKLNPEGEPAYDISNNTLDVSKMPYMLAWFLQISPNMTEQSYIEQCCDHVNTLLKDKADSSDSFISYLIDCLLEECGSEISSCDDLINQMLLAFGKINVEEITALEQQLTGNIEKINEYKKIANNPTANIILQYVYATKGVILSKYLENKQIIDGELDINDPKAVETFKEALGINKIKELPENLSNDASTALNAASVAFEQMFNDKNQLVLERLYTAYSALDFYKYQSDKLNLHNTMAAFINLVLNDNIKAMFNNDATQTAYKQIADAYEKQFKTITDYNNFINIIANGDKSIVDKLDLKNLGINDDAKYDAFAILINNKTEFFGCSLANANTALFNNSEYKDIEKPFENTSNIISELITDEKWPKAMPEMTFDVLFSVEDELQSELHWKSDGIDKLRKLAAYILQCAVTKYNSKRDIDEEFAKWIDDKTVIKKDEQKTTSFLILMALWRTLYDGVELRDTNTRGKLVYIIELADKALDAQFTDGTISGFFQNIISNKDAIQAFNVENFMNYINANIKLTANGASESEDEDNAQNKVDPKLCAQFKKYLMSDAFDASNKKLKAVQDFCTTISTLEVEAANAPKEVKEAIYYGFKALYEDEELSQDVIDFTVTVKGNEVLDRIAGNSVNTPLSDSEEDGDNQNQEASSSLNTNDIEQVNAIAQGAANQSQHLMQHS